jgi:uncharacterized glyoxalase superfamily protein PhnB
MAGTVPEGYHTITPNIVVKDCSRVIDFMKRALGAEERMRFAGPDGTVVHAELTLGDSVVMIGEANEQWPAAPAYLYVYVDDVDATFRTAVAAGGKTLQEPTDQFYGDRTAMVMDPAGNRWDIATKVEDVSEAEMEKRMKDLAPA